ncbi:RuvC family protein [Streptococcus agalactiae]|uniref:hypothetical protein n=1 Tax=Streptococcus agalactiae TaxID=1311 RepID=UPI00067D6751|nr:hypothetical protein [Streptococcus agalactiae]
MNNILKTIKLTCLIGGKIQEGKKNDDYYTDFISSVDFSMAMSSELKTIQLRAIQKYDKPFEDIVIEQNTVLGPNQQSSIKIGIATGIILGKLLAEEIYFVNVSTWRKYWKFSYKDRSKKSMKQQAINAVATEFDKQVKDDEADAILIGSYFVNFGKEYGDLESHKGS